MSRGVESGGSNERRGMSNGREDESLGKLVVFGITILGGIAFLYGATLAAKEGGWAWVIALAFGAMGVGVLRTGWKIVREE
jgi:hypothetical protein